MPITIDGSGTITGLSAGGLPDATVTTAEIADAAVTAAKMSGAQSGSAPIYGARAWVNFNGTGTVAIRASGNVSSITDNGVGNYTVNFSVAMPDTNYSAIAESAISAANTANDTIAYSTVSASSSQVLTNNPINAAAVDSALVHVAIFR